MRYQMKQKLFAWGDDFTIKAADGQTLLIGEASWSTPGSKP